MAEKIGFQCKAYYSSTDLDGNQNTPATVQWTEITKARDVSLELSDDEVDMSSRAGDGFKATLQGLRDWGMSFNMLWNNEDTVLAALRDAYLDRNPIALAFMDGDIEVAANEGPCGNFSVTRFERAEDMADAVVANITVKLYSYAEWYEVAGS